MLHKLLIKSDKTKHVRQNESDQTESPQKMDHNLQLALPQTQNLVSHFFFNFF